MLLIPPARDPSPAAVAHKPAPGDVASLPRLIAVVLALGGLFWGVFLLLTFGPAVLFPIPFGVGYVVTAGYIFRAAITSDLGVRRFIWGASILVQGAWLCLGIAEFDTCPNLFFWWWVLATAASVVALATEGRGPDAEPLVCSQ